MDKRLVRRSLVVFGLGFLTLTPALAGCISDCRDEYNSEVESCQLINDEPDDADDLRLCIENAKEQYDDCKDECTS